MSTELATNKTTGLAISDYSAEQIALIKNTVAQGATDLELGMFLELAKATGLNPFKKEIWFIKTKSYTNKRGERVEGRAQIMTGIDGFFRIANSNPHFDGIEHAYGPDIEIPISSEKSGVKSIVVPEWVESAVYRKDRNRPERRRAYWKEYAQDVVTYSGQLSLWGQKPRVMLEKCADATALRKAFPQELCDFYAPEEMPREYSAEDEERKTAAEIESEQRANYLRQQAAKQVDLSDYVIEFGSNKGKKISESSNSIFLERHLAKYADRIPESGKRLIQARIYALRAEHARMVRESEQAALESDEGWTPTGEERAEIEASEREEGE